MICNGCKGPFSVNKNILKCKVCDANFHCECLNVKSEEFSLLSSDFLSSWRCPLCINVTRRAGSNLNTPVRATQLPTTGDISMDISFNTKGSPEPICNIDDSKSLSEIDFGTFTQALYGKLQEWRNETNSDLLNIRDDIKDALSEIRGEIKSLRAEHATFKTNLSTLNQDVTQIKASIQFCSGEHNDLRKRMENVTSRTVEASPAFLNMEAKIDQMEQQARQCNIELCNIPERRNEYLPAIINNIGTALKVPIQPQDIVSIHRVPHAQINTTKPKNIIVKFMSRIKRDNILAAYRKTKTLKTDQISITGTSCRIYMNEHLTLKNKQLFRKCREVAKANNYKYVWVRNSALLVRERDDTAAFVIRSEADLYKIKPTPSISQGLPTTTTAPVINQQQPLSAGLQPSTSGQ